MPRILHVVAGLPPEGDPVAEFASKLAKAQKECGVDVVIAAPAGENLSVSAFEAEEAGVRIGRFAPSGSGQLCYSGEMLRNLRKVVKGADIVHVHGIPLAGKVDGSTIHATCPSKSNFVRR